MGVISREEKGREKGGINWDCETGDLKGEGKEIKLYLNACSRRKVYVG